MNSKTCSKCSQCLDVEKFSKFARSNDGYKAWCKSCSKVYMNQYRASNPHYREKEKNYQAQKNTSEEKLIENLNKAIERCKIRGIQIPNYSIEDSTL